MSNLYLPLSEISSSSSCSYVIPISSSYSISASYAQNMPTITGITTTATLFSFNNIGNEYINPIVSSSYSFATFQFTSGSLTSVTYGVPVNNDLIFSGSGNSLYIIFNPSGSINESSSGWSAVEGLNCINVTSLDVSNNSLTSLKLSGSTSLITLDCYENLLTSIDVSTLTSLSTCQVYQNNLTSITMSLSSSITYMNARFNTLNQSSVDAILGSLVNGGNTGGTIYLDDAGNSSPSSAGHASASILTGRGWSVLTN